MAPDPDPFELEDEDEADARPARRFAAPPPPDEDEDGLVEIELPPSYEEEPEAVDRRTVAEKRGRAVAVVAGRRPPPQGWPLEALAFPLRRPGPTTIVGAALLLLLLDLASRWNFFVGLLLKLALLPFLLRWQLCVASTTAGGHDAPSGWGRAMEMSREQIRGLGVLLVAGLLLLAPGLLAGGFGRAGLAVALYLVAGLWLAAGALGQAVGDPRLLRPWHALWWGVRHPVGLLLATAGWWASGLVEWAVANLTDAPTGAFLAASVGMRVAMLYLWLLSARARGVVGRSWSPFRDRDGPTSPGGR